MVTSSGRSRPSDKGGGGSHPDPEIRGGQSSRPGDKGGGLVSKNFLSVLQASVWSKNKGRPDQALPLDPPLT